MPQYDQFGNPVDQWGNPIPEAYLPPEYYDPQQSPYPDGGYGGDDPYYSGGENPAPEAPYAPPGDPSVPPPTTTTAPAADPSNPQAFIQSLLSGVGYGASGLKSLTDKFKAAGYNVWVDGNGGARGIITDPSGRNWNVLDPQEGMNWWSNPTGHAWSVREHVAGGGGGTGGGTTLPPINPEWTDPFTEPGPAIPTEPTYTPGQFNAPTAETILQDPSYLWRSGQGLGALENRKAAMGTLNSGGSIKDFINYNQNAASQEYSNVWGREFDRWNADEGNKLTAFRTNKDVTDTNYKNTWDQYLERKKTFFDNQNNAWNKYMDAGRLGAGM